jgi:hypothetical protein
MQVDSVVDKVFRKAYYVLKKFSHIDTYLFALLYKTFLRPILEYCSQICRPWHNNLLNKLESCQRRLTKWCFPIRTLSYAERLTRLQLPTVIDRLERGDAILMFQLAKGLLDVDSSCYITRNYNNTRGHCFKVQGTTARLDSRKFFFTERAIKIWNSLPEHVVTAPSLNCFKARYDSWKK